MNIFRKKRSIFHNQVVPKFYSVIKLNTFRDVKIWNNNAPWKAAEFEAGK